MTFLNLNKFYWIRCCFEEKEGQTVGLMHNSINLAINYRIASSWNKQKINWKQIFVTIENFGLLLRESNLIELHRMPMRFSQLVTYIQIYKCWCSIYSVCNVISESSLEQGRSGSLSNQYRFSLVAVHLVYLEEK